MTQWARIQVRTEDNDSFCAIGFDQVALVHPNFGGGDDRPLRHASYGSIQCRWRRSSALRGRYGGEIRIEFEPRRPDRYRDI
jgi:hypothetical protein